MCSTLRQLVTLLSCSLHVNLSHHLQSQDQLLLLLQNLTDTVTLCQKPEQKHSGAADLPAPEAGKPVPRVITFQRKRANRRVINEDQLMRMLREFGEVSLAVMQYDICYVMLCYVMLCYVMLWQ